MLRKLMTQASALAVTFLFIVGVGAVAAHTATSTCESITLANSSLYAIVVHHVVPADFSIGNIVLGPVAGNHTYAIAAGTYDVKWSDGVKVIGLEVATCATPTPTEQPTPTPTPTEAPTPTPTATSTPEEPTPTPTATSCVEGQCPTSTPSSDPTPTPSGRTVTPPPTSTTSGPTDGGNQSWLGILAALGLIAGIGVLLTPSRKRR